MTEVDDLVVWTGPVAEFQVPGATVSGAKKLFISCRGDRGPHPHCPSIGEELRHSPSALAEKAAVDPADVRDLFFGAFSAGGSLVRRLLENPDYRSVTTAVLLSDATYTGGWVDLENRIPPPIEGFVQYAVDVVEGPGDRLFVATASPSPNFGWATGVENLAATRREIERRTGRVFEPLDDFYGVDPAPERGYKLGNVIFGEYPMEPLGHGHTKIAPQIWQNILQPWLAKGKGPVELPGGIVEPLSPEPQDELPGEGWSVGAWLAVLGAGTAGFYLAYRTIRRSR